MLTYTPIISDPFPYHCFLGYYEIFVNDMGEKVIIYIFPHIYSGPIYQTVKQATRKLEPGASTFFWGALVSG